MQYKKTIKEFTEEVLKELKRDIDALVLYGSVAKGEVHEESDIDILVISKKGGTIEDKVLDISYSIDLKNGTVTSHVYYTPEEFNRLVNLGSPFAEDILTHGKVLYDNGTFQRLRNEVLRTGT